MSELKTYTEEELAEHQQLYDEVFTPVWESEGQYCRAGGGQYEKSFAWWAFKYQQSKVDELQKRVDALSNLIQDHLRELNECYESDKENKFEYWRGFSHSAGTSAKRLEQALKGGDV